MLVETVNAVRESGGNPDSLRLHGQEINLTTSAIAKMNLYLHGLEDFEIRRGDTFRDPKFTERGRLRKFDVVIANPPYIPWEYWEQVAVDVRTHEPALALFSGADGLDALRTVARVAARLLRPGGQVCAEHAEVQSDGAVAVFAEVGGFTRIVDHPDLTARPRFVTAQRVLAG